MRKLIILIGIIAINSLAAQTQKVLENKSVKIQFDSITGSIVSFIIKKDSIDLIAELNLAANFRILLPVENNMSNYIEGSDHKAAEISINDNIAKIVYRGMHSSAGKFDIDLTCSVQLTDNKVSFKSSLTNRTPYPVAEFWYPRLGGIRPDGKLDSLQLDYAGYTQLNTYDLFSNYPASRALGSEAAEFYIQYPQMMMPWWHLFLNDHNTGIYMGYHDTTMRISTWHTYLYPTCSGNPGNVWLTREESSGKPLGIVFSHVRYPYIKNGETFESGEFEIVIHDGDWHSGSLIYRDWFMKNFPFDSTPSWLRKESVWFTSIIYQPEDKVIADFEKYDRWITAAQNYGINTFELIGWNVGGLERNYPEYIPEPKLGGKEGFKKLMSSIKQKNGKCLVFVNYNIFDCNTDLYKTKLKPYTHQDGFGNTPNWMAWGESTLTARSSMSVRRHVLSSVLPEVENLLQNYYNELIVDGASAFQIDKVVVSTALDFNPLNTLKPDVALCDGLVKALKKNYDQCKKLNSGFCFASEARHDRMIPFINVFYRCAEGFNISPLKYTFPEWTSCSHISQPCDYNGVNGAVMTGAVICYEPDCYQNSPDDTLYKKLSTYIREVTRIRKDLSDIIFTGLFLDNTCASVHSLADEQSIHYKVHSDKNKNRFALIVANDKKAENTYTFSFENPEQVKKITLYEPFNAPKEININEPVSIKEYGLQIIVTEYNNK